MLFWVKSISWWEIVCVPFFSLNSILSQARGLNLIHRDSACKSSSYVIVLIENKHDEGVLSGNITAAQAINLCVKQSRYIQHNSRNNIITATTTTKRYINICRILCHVNNVRCIHSFAFLELRKLFIELSVHPFLYR